MMNLTDGEFILMRQRNQLQQQANRVIGHQHAQMQSAAQEIAELRRALAREKARVAQLEIALDLANRRH